MSQALSDRPTSRIRTTAGRNLLRLAVSGLVVGILFNLAFGAAPWQPGGLAGGLIAGILIHAVS
jgi:hypothetical protein